MLWEVEIRPLGRDNERDRVGHEYDLLTQSQQGRDWILATSRGYLLEGELTAEVAERFAQEVLVDSIVESHSVRPLGQREPADGQAGRQCTVLLKPGVMDSTAQTVLETARRMRVPLAAVRTFRRYYLHPAIPTQQAQLLARKVLANAAIEHVVFGPLQVDHLGMGSPYQFRLVTVPIREADDEVLLRISRDGMLALSLEEMRAIQQHYRAHAREPTDCELETIAQTWSEHCSHKTLKGIIRFRDARTGVTRIYNNLLKETIFAATQTIRNRLGPDDWCVSVFEDNAGVVRFDERYHLCFKVETHNHPSAIEPYGGASTGIGGVIRDVLGTGRSAKPIANTNVFCFAPPDWPPEELPEGVLHPRRVLHGVVAGVRDYGNRMGIPTVNGAIVFDPRYLANPLVYCGTVGLLPCEKADKRVEAGDLIVVLGGRTGRDGIHGATFSSLELTHESEAVSGGAVQLGNALTEKKLLDALLSARDRELFHAVTDCGAGGFSSAIGEMAAGMGATVHLEAAPLKYEGLSYTEIWISESQERMILAVPPGKWPELQALCQSEDVEAAVLGTFEPTGRLRLHYAGHEVADLDLQFLHGGRPAVVREAVWPPPDEPNVAAATLGVTTTPQLSAAPCDWNEALLRLLAHPTIASKEWVIRQYDHEVQSHSVIKPLVGVANDGPSDAAVLKPLPDKYLGVAIGCGINPLYGDIDPYHMAALAIDEAVRNVVAVGADPGRIAILDNFCWGDINDPYVLGALVRAAEGCRDTAIAYGVPFISGKDSLHNTYRSPDGQRRNIPGTLLISAIGRVPDVRRCVTMDLKEPGHRLYLVGPPAAAIGGTLYQVLFGQGDRTHKDTTIVTVDADVAVPTFAALHRTITCGWVRACHDVSEGGLAVALAEMAFAGGIGVEVTTLPGDGDVAVRLFGESPSRFVVEVDPETAAGFEQSFAGLPLMAIGTTIAEPRLRIAGSAGGWLIDAGLAELKETWQKPLRAG